MGLGVLASPLVAAPGTSEGSSGIDWDAARQTWAFTTPQTHSAPAVQDVGWPEQPLDYFILAKLDAVGFKPTLKADRRTLLRRLTLDLTGLLPTPKEMQAFLSETRHGAYARVVDRLLGSPRFGERLASLWLNVARYAEDQAHLVDNDKSSFYPNAYHYRDWVIDAFNRDLPYDQFIRLQLAADLIATNQPNAAAALGFVGLGPKYYDRGRLNVMADEWDDRVDTVTRSFLGLTVACARCHDHKYDPITMEDYYALAGVFASTRLVNKFPDGTEYKAPKNKKERIKAIVPAEVLHVLADSEVKDLNLFVRGDVENPGPVVPRRFLRILGDLKPFSRGSGRGELAEAIADPENPLTARVMVNRLWGLVFGQSLVGSPSNFGGLSDPPSHPELLDTLAVSFVESGWSIKTLIRQFVLSATYRQNSTRDPAVAKRDPANRWLAGMNRRRLTVEQWRDSVLAVAGNLDFTSGPSLELDDPNNVRRTVHGRISRLSLNELLILFDYPDPNVHAARRPVTTTSMQKLYVLNAPFLLQQAESFAEHLTQQPESTNAVRIQHAYESLYGRPPTEQETQLGLAFLEQPDEDAGERWTRYAHVLLSANELLYVD